MHCSRSVCRNPNAVRVARFAPQVRNASFFPAPFFPRFPGAAFSAHNEIAPFFRLFDDLTAPVAPHRGNFTFQPRFDVREVDNTYELRGEIPGVEGKDIEVEFSDDQTLIVRGRTEKETSSGTPPTAAAAPADVETSQAEADVDNSDAASTYSTGSYQKPSVEDEAPEYTETAETKEKTTETSNEKQVEATPEQPEQASTRYWVSERSTGSFQRVFSFPSRIDQEAVKASLKNGILSIVVPKAAAPAAKRINVE